MKVSPRERKRREAGERYQAELDAIDAEPVASLVKRRADAVLSVYRRIEKAIGTDRQATRVPPVLRRLWLVQTLNGFILVSHNGFPAFLQQPSQLIAHTRAALRVMKAARQLRILEQAMAGGSPTVLEAAWKHSNPKWPDPFRFEEAYVARHAAAIDRALARLARA